MIIAFDPSINHVGCAQVQNNGTYIDSTTLKSSGSSSQDKLQSLYSAITKWLAHREADIILIEHTRFFARSQNQSHASAQKLNLAKGLIFGACKSHGAPVHLVWIPGFNKQQAELIARAYKTPHGISQHEKDAFWLANTWSQSSPLQKEQYQLEPHPQNKHKNP